MTKNATCLRIRQLNDGFRRSFIGGRVMLTRGINSLSPEDKQAILAAVQAFDVFTHANDPHGEHDFGQILHEGIKAFWKIDYYDHTLRYASPNPADPSKTCRVLTIMLAEEY